MGERSAKNKFFTALADSIENYNTSKIGQSIDPFQHYHACFSLKKLGRSHAEEIDTTKGPLAGLLVLYKMSQKLMFVFFFFPLVVDG